MARSAGLAGGLEGLVGGLGLVEGLVGGLGLVDGLVGGLGLVDGLDGGFGLDGGLLVGLVGGFVVAGGLSLGVSGSGEPNVGPSTLPSIEPKIRVAPNSLVQRTGVRRTLRPVRGASTIMPSPAYIATWWMPVQLLDELKNSRSPGSSE